MPRRREGDDRVADNREPGEQQSRRAKSCQERRRATIARPGPSLPGAAPRPARSNTSCAEIVADRGGHDGATRSPCRRTSAINSGSGGQRQERRGEKAPAEQRHIRSHRSDSRLPDVYTRCSRSCCTANMAIAGGVHGRLCAVDSKTAGGSVGAPKVGWVVMMGDRDNPDRDFVCYSEAPGDCGCRRVARRTGVRRRSPHYRPAATETSDGGTVQIGFLRQPARAQTQLHREARRVARQPERRRHCSASRHLSDDDRVDATPTRRAARQIREQVKIIVR